MKANKIILESDYNEMFDSLISKKFSTYKKQVTVFLVHTVLLYIQKRNETH